MSKQVAGGEEEEERRRPRVGEGRGRIIAR